MTETTPRLGLPLLPAGQAQKEVLHNEALTLVDALLPALIEAAGVNVPPGAPISGQAWIVGTAPVGDWAGRAGAIAIRTDGGWRFVTPVEGMTARLRTSGYRIERGPSGWSAGEIAGSALRIGGDQVVGARLPAIPDATGGAIVDMEARAAVSAIIVALRTHGLIAI